MKATRGSANSNHQKGCTSSLPRPSRAKPCSSHQEQNPGHLSSYSLTRPTHPRLPGGLPQLPPACPHLPAPCQQQRQGPQPGRQQQQQRPPRQHAAPPDPPQRLAQLPPPPLQALLPPPPPAAAPRARPDAGRPRHDRWGSSAASPATTCGVLRAWRGVAGKIVFRPLRP